MDAFKKYYTLHREAIDHILYDHGHKEFARLLGEALPSSPFAFRNHLVSLGFRMSNRCKATAKKVVLYQMGLPRGIHLVNEKSHVLYLVRSNKVVHALENKGIKVYHQDCAMTQCNDALARQPVVRVRMKTPEDASRVLDALRGW